jgi:hypothetical protein
MRQRRVPTSKGLSTNLSTTIKYVRRSCSSAECSSDVTAPRRRRQRSKLRPEHHNQVRAMHSERHCGKGTRHHDKVPATHKKRRRERRPRHHDQVPATNNRRLICRLFYSFCGSVASPQAAVWAPAWVPRSRTCDRSYVQRLHLAEGTSLRVLLSLCVSDSHNIYSVPLLMNTASKLGPHTQTDRGTCPGVGL